MRQRILADLNGARRAAEALRQHAPAVAALRRYLVPSALPTTRGVDVAVRLVAAEGLLAGDWYDVITLSDQRWRINIVDVAGHGPDAGVLALRTKTFLEAAYALELDMGATLGWLGDRLGDTGDQFLTAHVIEIDVANGTLHYASAGHPPMLLRPPEGPPVDLLPTGPLLGPLPGDWSTVTCSYETGALLVAYTDGLTEARNPAGEQYGIERLSAVIEAHRTRTADDIASATTDAVNEFAGPDTQDDITLVVIRRPGSVQR